MRSANGLNQLKVKSRRSRYSDQTMTIRLVAKKANEAYCRFNSPIAHSTSKPTRLLSGTYSRKPL